MDGSAVSALYQYKTTRNNEGVPASEVKSDPQTQTANSKAEETRFADNNIKTTLSTAALGPKNTEPATRETEVRWDGEDDFHSPDWFAVLGPGGCSGDDGTYRSITAYRDESSTEENPVFYIQTQDGKGTKAYMIELNKIDRATRRELKCAC